MKFSTPGYASAFLENVMKNDRTKHTKRDGTIKVLSWGPDLAPHQQQKHIAVNKVKRFIYESLEKNGKKAEVIGNIWKGIVLIDWKEVINVRVDSDDITPKIQIKDSKVLHDLGIDGEELLKFVRSQM